MILLSFNYVFLNHTVERRKNKRLVFKNHELVDFFINYSLLLGVMGTLLSIGIAVSEVQGAIEFAEVISGSFSSALVTTIVGGIIYGYCYLGNSYLSYLSNKDECSQS